MNGEQEFRLRRKLFHDSKYKNLFLLKLQHSRINFQIMKIIATIVLWVLSRYNISAQKRLDGNIVLKNGWKMQSGIVVSAFCMESGYRTIQGRKKCWFYK
jgi:divalent metal cation (Fe/Co/Zn/Cd) transporter